MENASVWCEEIVKKTISERSTVAVYGTLQPWILLTLRCARDKGNLRLPMARGGSCWTLG